MDCLLSYCYIAWIEVTSIQYCNGNLYEDYAMKDIIASYWVVKYVINLFTSDTRYKFNSTFFP